MQVNSSAQACMGKMDGVMGQSSAMKEAMQSMSDEDRSAFRGKMSSLSQTDRAAMKEQISKLDVSSYSSDDLTKTLMSMFDSLQTSTDNQALSATTINMYA